MLIFFYLNKLQTNTIGKNNGPD